jgi:hypothetical protein
MCGEDIQGGRIIQWETQKGGAGLACLWHSNAASVVRIV